MRVMLWRESSVGVAQSTPATKEHSRIGRRPKRIGQRQRRACKKIDTHQIFSFESGVRGRNEECGDKARRECGEERGHRPNPSYKAAATSNQRRHVRHPTICTTLRHSPNRENSHDPS